MGLFGARELVVCRPSVAPTHGSLGKTSAQTLAHGGSRASAVLFAHTGHCGSPHWRGVFEKRDGKFREQTI